MFLSSLPKGKGKASGGYSQGGSNSLFFHPAGGRILPSACCSPAPRLAGPQRDTVPTPACFKGPHNCFGACQSSSLSAGSFSTGWRHSLVGPTVAGHAHFWCSDPSSAVTFIFWAGQGSTDIPMPKSDRAWCATSGLLPSVPLFAIKHFVPCTSSITGMEDGGDAGRDDAGGGRGQATPPRQQ